MNLVNDFLQVSAKLFKHLTVIPTGEERTDFIEKINELLNERGDLVKKLKSSGFCYDKNNGIHKTLNELDQGIQERLQLVCDAVKTDILTLQNSKKHEIQYVNPYGSLRNLDGRYYDGKK